PEPFAGSGAAGDAAVRTFAGRFGRRLAAAAARTDGEVCGRGGAACARQESACGPGARLRPTGRRPAGRAEEAQRPPPCPPSKHGGGLRLGTAAGSSPQKSAASERSASRESVALSPW